ncbi:sensor histidine kinase [Pareuzebyella sediminis]|uniref:sensor histidine kinase n=1 Tax=Pareuzebyella sediminis TaxID=2607998 RepID=UPI0011F08701|nr:sensor histidine kinase [Pareuzebyella sediminis]
MRFRLTGTALLTVLLLLFIVINIVLWTQVFNRMNTYSENIYELETLRATTRLKDAENRINKLYDTSKKDVLFLKDLIEFDLNQEKSLAQTKQRILKFVQRNKEYFQARFIDTLGIETLKIEKIQTKAEIKDEENLQSKEDRYYFQESLELKNGQVFVSELNLNIEKGKIEKPYRPTVRFFTPVFVKERKIGIIGLNLNIKNWFQVFEGKNLGILNSENEIYLNSNGILYGKSTLDLTETDAQGHPLYFSKKISLEGNRFWTLFTRANDSEINTKLQNFKLEMYVSGAVLTVGLLFTLLISGILYKRKRKIKRLNQSIANRLHERDTLIRELHHRVKNNLQVVSSLLSLQSSFVTDKQSKAMLRYSQYRINSMGMVHQMLYSGDNLNKIDFEAYIEELANALILSMKGRNSGIELELGIKDVVLNIDTAIPLGLIINEIITNSLKYGFPNTPGTITIKIDQTDSVWYRLEIGDNGVGMPDTINFRNTKSLGLKLIHKLSLQLRGTVGKDNSKKGTNFIITFQEIEQTL